jgi:glyoxylase-like metal-dependent hydrolase (beta-lactamase superfamily II)
VVVHRRRQRTRDAGDHERRSADRAAVTGSGRISRTQDHREPLLHRHRDLVLYLITTPQGNIVINSDYEETLPLMKKAIESLGFKMEDTKILLASHAHGDHQMGDAMFKQMTGAQTMFMAEDVPALQNMKAAGKDHPIDRVAPRRRQGGARWDDVDRASDAWPHVGDDDMDLPGTRQRTHI